MLKKQIVVAARLDGPMLEFPFQAPEGGKVFDLRFSRANKREKVSERFVECSGGR